MSPFWNNLALVTPVSLALACVATVALIGACVMLIARAAFSGSPGTVLSDTPAPSRWRSALWLTMLFLVVFLAKLALMQSTPVTAPFSDQWDGEAAVLFVPFHENRLDWPAMIGFHNEHRVLFSRLLALGLFTVNGQWDPRLEQVVNAAIHSLTAVLLTTLFWMSSGWRRLDLFVLVSTALFALPFAWENTLVGFQSAFYFLMLFSVLALWLTTTDRPGSGAWWLGWLCAVCSLLTAAGGVITPAAIVAITALRLADDRRWRDALVNGGAAALVLALGFLLTSPPLAHHAALKAQTAAEFQLAFARNLAWPWIDRPWVSVAMWLPLGVVLAAAVFRRGRTTDSERFAAGVGLWVGLNAAAVAYGRGVGGAFPASRYQDFLSLGLAVNLVALTALVDRTRATTLIRHIAVGTLVVWLLLAFVGLDRLVGRAMTDLATWRPYFSTQASSVRRFVSTDDVSGFLALRPWIDLPYPDPNRLATLLQDPYIRRILPADVQAPLRVESRVSTNGAFVLGGPFADSLPRDPLQRVWTSLSEQGRKAQGRFESQPLTCQLGRLLRFQVAGYLGWVGQHLALSELGSGDETVVTPVRLARENWSEVVVPCPPGPFAIIAIDEAADSWFAFREPVEIGRPSVAAESLIRHSREPLVVLLGIAVLALAVRWT